MKSGLYHTGIIRQAVRNSLTGSTRKILQTLSDQATTEEIIQKVESNYGNVKTGEAVVSEFYLAKQEKGESVTDWGIRIESILRTAIRKGQVNADQADEMLRKRFWKHLYDVDLKNSTRLYFESTKSFEELRRKVRT